MSKYHFRLIYSIIFLMLGSCSSPGTLIEKIPKEKRNIGIQVAPRNAFPVFNNPKFVTAERAEAKGYVNENEPVIGLYINGEAKAYPIKTMGVHELGNNVVGGTPVAVSW